MKEDLSREERLPPLTCFAVYVFLFAIYIITGIISFNIMDPSGSGE
jgi:hypothetical protein